MTKANETINKIGALITVLRGKMAKIETIDPESAAYLKMCRFLDERTNDELDVLAAADIRFVSLLAMNRIIRRRIAA